MQLCNKGKIEELFYNHRILIKNIQSLDSIFLDNFRIGFSLRDMLWKISGPIDLTNLKPTYTEINLSTATLLPNNLYLGISQEEISLPNNMIGIINTRSKYARLGLEMVRSSFFVAPNFGQVTPTPIVFEISVNCETNRLTTWDRYAYITFFELDGSVSTSEFDYWKLFPLNTISHRMSK